MAINIKDAVEGTLDFVVGTVGGLLRKLALTDVEADTDDFFRAEGDGSTRGVPAATAAQGVESNNIENPLVPGSIVALLGKGADLASGGTVTFLNDGNYAHITGTTAITDIDYTTGGRLFWVCFDSVLTLTYHATTLILPTGASITTAAGDTALFVLESGDNVRCLVYFRKDGNPLVTGGVSTASTTEILTGTDSTKAATPDAVAALWEQGSNITSAATISVGEGGYFHVTGSTGPITDIDFATDKAGRLAMLVFDSTPQVTHNASTLILNGGANITMAAGDLLIVRSEGTDVVRCWHFPAAVTGSGSAVRATSPTLVTPTLGAALATSVNGIGLTALTTTVGSAVVLKEGSNNGPNTATIQCPASLASDAVYTLPAATATLLGSTDIGTEHWYIDADQMAPAITNGAAYGFWNSGSNMPDVSSLDFDTTTTEYAHFKMAMPPRWDEGTITFRVRWTAASGSGTIAFTLQGLACGDDDAIGQAFGTAQTASDTLITAVDQHTSAFSSAITIAGTPTAGNMVFFRIGRDVANDTLGVDARLLGVVLAVTCDALKDA